MAVEQNLGCRREKAKQGNRGRELVNENIVVLRDLIRKEQGQREVELSQNRAENTEASQKVRRNDRIPSDTNIKCP